MNGTTHSKTTTWLLSFAVFFGLGTIVLGPVWPENVPAQPIRFNHAIHVSNGLTCEDCHAGALTREKATLPQLDTCLTCHREAVTTKPEEEKIRVFARAGREIQWVQLMRVPEDVYFSHRRHTVLGGLKCAECHGPMESYTEPPRRAFRRMKMDDCIECHKQRKASNDCNDCHR